MYKWNRIERMMLCLGRMVFVEILNIVEANTRWGLLVVVDIAKAHPTILALFSSPIAQKQLAMQTSNTE